MVGTGIQYYPSPIVNAEHQSSAKNLIVGERIIPHIFLRAGDSRPIDMQDLCPADMRIKILVFGGDVTVEGNVSRLRAIGKELDKPGSFLHRFGRTSAPADWKVFDVLCFSAVKWDTVDYTGGCRVRYSMQNFLT